MLSNILYGTSSLSYGGLTLTAIAAGERGAGNSFSVTLSGSSIVITVANSHLGKADIQVTAPSGTNEAGLLAALSTSADFLRLASAVQSSGNGTGAIAPLAKTSFAAATGGLRQRLALRLSILGWDARELVATGAAVGLLWPAEAKIYRQTADPDGQDHWAGTFQAGIAFQQNTDFETQNILIDLFRRALYVAVKGFTHPDLIDIGPDDFLFTNTTKDEAAGTVLSDARLRVSGKFPIQWNEGAAEAMDVIAGQVPFTALQSGLFVEPLVASMWRLTFDCDSFTLSYGGGTTIEIAVGANLGPVIQAALESLASVGSGNVMVVQTGGAYSIAFSPTLPPLNALTGTATGGNARIHLARVQDLTTPGDNQAVLDSEISVAGL